MVDMICTKLKRTSFSSLQLGRGKEDERQMKMVICFQFKRQCVLPPHAAPDAMFTVR